jgi:RimJ/RimL family protein N-acetyltransferase
MPLRVVAALAFCHVIVESLCGGLEHPKGCCQLRGIRAVERDRSDESERIGQFFPELHPGVGDPGHVRPAAGEAELGYLFLPEAWGCGYAAEACAAALDWFTGALPGEPVVLCTQTANVRSMRLAAKLGFIEVERFEDYGAEQWFGVWSSVTPSD